MIPEVDHFKVGMILLVGSALGAIIAIWAWNKTLGKSIGAPVTW